jgi:hypothetical protein
MCTYINDSRDPTKAGSDALELGKWEIKAKSTPVFVCKAVHSIRLEN